MFSTLFSTQRRLRKAEIPALAMITPSPWRQAWRSLQRNRLAMFCLLLLAVMLVYTWFKPQFGQVDAGRPLTGKDLWAGLAIGASIGFYDGFFGPGTGSFFAIAFVALAGFNLAKATAHSKLLNFTSNLAALIFFAIGGKLVWSVGLSMAVGQFIGARLGSRMVIKQGGKLIRPLIVIMSLAMSAKLLLQQYGG